MLRCSYDYIAALNAETAPAPRQRRVASRHATIRLPRSRRRYCADARSAPSPPAVRHHAAQKKNCPPYAIIFRHARGAKRRFMLTRRVAAQRVTSHPDSIHFASR